MTERFRITIAQLNPVMGDLIGNASAAFRAWEVAVENKADLVALPEMFLVGYNPQDSICRHSLISESYVQLKKLAEATKLGAPLAIGAPALEEGCLYNAYFILQNGEIRERFLKHHLPNDTVFDEQRIFTSGQPSGPIQIGALRIGFPVCEDAWHPDIVETYSETGAEFLLVPNGSPYHRGKHDVRLNQMVSRCIETSLPLIYLNMVGGQDDQAFDGGSFALNGDGTLAAQLQSFEEEIAHLDLLMGDRGWQIQANKKAARGSEYEEDYHAMVLSLRDYLRKNGFQKTLLGLSGGVDSALVAVIAADAVGAENLRCVMLPSRYTSQHSLEDAAALAARLGCQLDELPISGPVSAAEEVLAPMFAGLSADLTEENMQSRMRGLLLMALSNKFGEMLLTTGNKSEVAVGYATIYGDMAGGYNPIKDLYKMRVFEMCRWRNAHYRDWMKGREGEVIPPRIIEKPPSAELREDQRDEDSLPPYEDLDRILELLIDQERSVEECVQEGFDIEIVRKIEKLIYLAEYKRFQSAPGTRLTERAFWMDRRYPITNQWRDPV